MTVWILPVLLLVTTTALAVPLAFYIAWIMDGKYKAPAWLRWIEGLVNTGPQSWKQYTVSLLLFNTVMFGVGYLLLALQPLFPLAYNLGANAGEYLSPTTVFNTAVSFFTNTNLQNYAGEVHFTYFSQIFFILFNMFLSASVGVCCLTGIIRALRGDRTIGNYYLDMWRVAIYMYLPLAFLTSLPMMAAGVPMTLESYAGSDPKAPLTTLDVDANGQPQTQTIARGPVAAMITIKHLGTNGGGFFNANSAHPFENPNAWSDFITVVSIMAFPFALVFAYGIMLKHFRHALVIYGVMMFMLLSMIVWSVSYDSLAPNPGLTAQVGRVDAIQTSEDGKPKYSWLVIPPGGTGQAVDRDPKLEGKDKPATPTLPGLPVDQSDTGNLEGKELRFGRSAGATFAACTTAIACGSVNCMHDSLNPLAGLSPLSGMWLNCVFGGKGVGMVNMLVYIIVAVFIAGLMVGRTPEYLGKKIEAREMKLAMIALLIHPIIILLPSGLYAAWNATNVAMSNPAAHGFAEILYQFSSSAANNGSAFAGLGSVWGFNNPGANPSPPGPASAYFDIGTGLVILLGRLVPVVAPLALAGGLIVKKPTPFTVGTLRTDTLTFAFFLLGTILLVGALLFMPAAMLSPVAEHLGPIPFGN